MLEEVYAKQSCIKNEVPFLLHLVQLLEVVLVKPIFEHLGLIDI